MHILRTVKPVALLSASGFGVALILAAPAVAQTYGNAPAQSEAVAPAQPNWQNTPAPGTSTPPQAHAVPAQANLPGAQAMLDDASAAINKMETDPQLVKLMERAKGILIVPKFGSASFIVGGRGGSGVLLAHNGRRWSDPVFFNMGGGSIGLQAGITGGSVAFLIMSDKVMNNFRQGSNWSLNADAGFTIVNYNAVTPQASWGKGGDVIVWSNMGGAYAGARVGVTDIVLSDSFNRALYGTADPRMILAGQITRNQYAQRLRNEMPA